MRPHTEAADRRVRACERARLSTLLVVEAVVVPIIMGDHQRSQHGLKRRLGAGPRQAGHTKMPMSDLCAATPLTAPVLFLKERAKQHPQQSASRGTSLVEEATAPTTAPRNTDTDDSRNYAVFRASPPDRTGARSSALQPSPSRWWGARRPARLPGPIAAAMANTR